MVGDEEIVDWVAMSALLDGEREYFLVFSIIAPSPHENYSTPPPPPPLWHAYHYGGYKLSDH